MGWTIGGYEVPEDDSPLQSSSLPRIGPLQWADFQPIGSMAEDATIAQRTGRASAQGVLNFRCSTTTMEALTPFEGQEIEIIPPTSINPNGSRWLVKSVSVVDFGSGLIWTPGDHYVSLVLLHRETLAA